MEVGALLCVERLLVQRPDLVVLARLALVAVVPLAAQDVRADLHRRLDDRRVERRRRACRQRRRVL